jgi:thiamine biosynthesis lipoprotein
VIRRAKPLLGTIVSIAADAAPAALDAAFTAVARVHVLMSAQEARSDISRINREAHRRPVTVDPWTQEVLELALFISERTTGTFDIIVPGTGARYTDIALANGAVRLRKPARLDVSGIAKGFAVDCAVKELRRQGARSGSVNAGGELRFFGDVPEPVRVRTPGEPGRSVCLPPLPYPAYATSSGYFGTTISDPRNGKTATLAWSVTVAAATCAIADALTKAVALLGPVPALLNAFDAAAFAVDGHGRLHAAAR